MCIVPSLYRKLPCHPHSQSKIRAWYQKNGIQTKKGKSNVFEKSAYLCASNIALTMCASQSIIGRKGKKSVLALVTSTIPIDVRLASTLAIHNVTDAKAANGTWPVTSTIFAPCGVPLLQIPKKRFALIANPALNIGLAGT